MYSQFIHGMCVYVFTFKLKSGIADIDLILFLLRDCQPRGFT